MFIGNTQALKLLNNSLKNGKISQAYLFSGPKSVGKFTLARFFAESIISGKNALGSDNISLSGNNFDILVIEPEIEEKRGIKKEKDIKIEKIREAQKKLALYPYSGKKKVLILNNAHRMTISSQNALLKNLEEPNETSVIILVTHNDSEILPTIKSRCQKINFSLASGEEIRKMLGNKKEMNELVFFSMGRPGLAFRLMEDRNELENQKKELDCLKKFSDMGINERFKLAEKLSSDTAQALKKFEFWIWVIRLEAMKKIIGEGFFSFKTINKIEKSLETIKNTNANARLSIENLFLEI